MKVKRQVWVGGLGHLCALRLIGGQSRDPFTCNTNERRNHVSLCELERLCSNVADGSVKGGVPDSLAFNDVCIDA